MDIGNSKINKINQNMGILNDINHIEYFNETINAKTIKRSLKNYSKLTKKEIRNRIREERRYNKVKVNNT